MFRSNGRPRGPQATAMPRYQQYGFAPGTGVLSGSNFEIVRDKEIEPAIVIVIEKCAAGVVPYPILHQMCHSGHIFKALASDVPIQPVAAPVRHEQVGIPVIVIIACADALAPTFRAQARTCGDVGELVTAVVVIQPITPTLPGNSEYVEEPVVVVVQEGDTAAGGFDDELLRGSASVGKYVPKTRRCGDIAEICARPG